MPYSRPTLTQLRQQTVADVQAELPGTEPLLRFSNLRILAQVLAGLQNQQFGYIDWIARQAIPITATDEALEAWAAFKEVFRKPSTAWRGVIQIVGCTPSADLPVGAPVTLGNSLDYATTADAVADGSGQILAAVEAVLDLGELYGSRWNLDVGANVTLGSAYPGVNSSGVVQSVTTPGTDMETDDELRARMLQAFANPPQGGAKADYVEWATGIAGVTRAWCYPMERGPGTVTVRFMMDDVRAGTGGFPIGTDGVATDESRDAPATGDQLTVANVIYDLRPVTPIVYLVAPLANPVAFTIAGLSLASSGVKAAIEAAIADVFAKNGEPGGSVDVDLIEKAIGAVSGSSGFVITVISPAHGSVSPGAAGNVTSDAGYLPTLGVVTWA